MNLNLSWDLVIGAAFGLLFAYNFMLGQKNTVKLLICNYMAMMAADGLAGMLKDYVFDFSVGLQNLLGKEEVMIFTWVRLILFLLITILFVVKSGFEVHLERHPRVEIRMAIHTAFSAISALLFLSTMIIYLGGISVTEGLLFARDLELYRTSLLARLILDYLQIWFTLPAILFLITSFVADGREEE